MNFNKIIFQCRNCGEKFKPELGNHVPWDESGIIPYVADPFPYALHKCKDLSGIGLADTVAFT